MHTLRTCLAHLFQEQGRYTQLLADGLPLYGGQASSLGVLQIAPTDLGQVEVLKGAASALYGSSALGGVINLISRRPADAFEAEVLANATTRDGQDLTAYLSSPLGDGWSASVTGGAHRQSGRTSTRTAGSTFPFTSASPRARACSGKVRTAPRPISPWVR